MILRILIASILVGIIATVNAEARNEYLNDGTNSCDQGSWEAYSEVRQQEYKTGTNDESQQQVVGLRWRKSIGPVCNEEFAKEQRKKPPRIVVNANMGQDKIENSVLYESIRFVLAPKT